MSQQPITLCACTAEAIRDMRQIGVRLLRTARAERVRTWSHIYRQTAQDCFRRAAALVLDERRRLDVLGCTPIQRRAPAPVRAA